MITKILKLYLYVFLLCSVSSTCFSAPPPTISVLGFVNRVKVTNVNGDLVGYSSIINDYLVSELIDGGNLDVHEQQSVNDNETLEKTVNLIEKGKGKDALKSINTEYVIYGYLTNISIKNSVSEFNSLTGTSFSAKSGTVYVNISAKVVERKSGRIVFVAAGKGESSGGNNIGGQYDGHIMRVANSDVAQENINKAIEKAIFEIGKKINEAV